ncbi:hypothetical protein [Cystobacter ferrugineus]|uniref:DUF2690 domain-containing protein n=1 Tax=Cystobacter ferrugineus TaxID=83449 RepID=A0A1L9BHS8_9BACT|nr:hypothetical protein [Cystobacter ferrugineus]OJH41738.1 hypothetical protein BON30_00370 [Cystobacter ferrugineus]
MHWRHTVALVVGMLFASFALGGVPEAQAQYGTAPCTGSGCFGKSPVSHKNAAGYGCADNTGAIEAKKVATAPIDAPRGNNPSIIDEGILVVELVYSSWCQAYWSRVTLVPADNQPLWSFEAIVTGEEGNYGNPASIVLAVAPDNVAQSRMMDSQTEACGSYYLDGNHKDTVCAGRPELRFIRAVQRGTPGVPHVSTNCNTPVASTSSGAAANIWHFRLVGLVPPATRYLPSALSDAFGGYWQNYRDATNSIYCPKPGRWPFVDQAIVRKQAFGGFDLYLAAYPGTDTPGTQPPSGRSYAIEVKQDTPNPTLWLNWTQP